MKKIINFLFKHKFITFILITAIATGSYYGYTKTSSEANTIKYVSQPVQKGILISAISGIGQVASSNQLEIKPKTAGDITEIKIVNGEEVKEGDLLFQIDNKDAARRVNEAKASLDASRLDLAELLSPPDKLSLLQSENSVASARSNLEKLIEPADAFSLAQAENALISAKDSLTKLKLNQEIEYQNSLKDKEQSEINLENYYEESYNKISNAFLDLPDIMTDLHTVLFSTEISENEISLSQNSNDSSLLSSLTDYTNRNDFTSYLNRSKDDYEEADTSYTEAFNNYKDTTRYSNSETIEDLLEETVETVKKISDAVKSQFNMLDIWVKYRAEKNLKTYSTVTGYQSSLGSFTSQTNSHLTTLISAQSSIENYKEAILDAARDQEYMNFNHPIELAASERTVNEKENSLAELKAGADQSDIEAARRSLSERKLSLENLKAGADALAIKNKRISIQQKENTLIEARQNYDNCSVLAPFAGKITSLAADKGDSVSSGSAIATIITPQKIAEITLNEIDAAKIKVGQKVNLIFDAIENFSVTGKVAEIDAIGSVTQGVVSYGIKISFDVQDKRIKPGMSVSASIIIESKPNVLLAPLSAVKTMGDISYVEILENGQPKRQTITIGSSNDTMIEITGGLNENDNIITQTTNGSPSSNNTSSSSKQGQPNSTMRGMMKIMH